MAEIERPKGCTRTLGASQGYIPLPLRDEMIIDKATGKEVNSMVTVWRLSMDEKLKLMNGEPLVLRLLGTHWPPALIYVGDDTAPPEDPSILPPLPKRRVE